MSPLENIRFEELVSRYFEESLTSDEELELYELLTDPALGKSFEEMVKLNGEIRATLEPSVSAEEMSARVMHELANQHKLPVVLPLATMTKVKVEARNEGRATAFGSTAARTPILLSSIKHAIPPSEPVSVQRRPIASSFAIGISLALHAAMIMLILTLHFDRRAEQQHAASAASNPRPVAAAQPDIEHAVEPMATLRSVTGRACTIEEAGAKMMQTGSEVIGGQPLQTIGAQSAADVVFSDGTTLELKADTKVSSLSSGNLASQPAGALTSGKYVVLDSGTLCADVTHQPAGAPMAIVTPEAEVLVIGTRFTLTSLNGKTRLDVEDGIVRMKRRSDGETVLVKGGEFAVVAPRSSMTSRKAENPQAYFVKGINIRGSAVAIDGHVWLSHEQALLDGFTITATVPEKNFPPYVVSDIPRGTEAGSGLRYMLQSRQYSFHDDMRISQRIENGDYDVFFWVFEAAMEKRNDRYFDVKMEGVLVQQDVGGMIRGEWHRYGPYSVRVDDESLDIDCIRLRGSTLMSGLAIFRKPSAPVRSSKP